MKKSILLVLVLSVVVSGVAQITSGEQSQINRLVPQPIPQSPNVSALGKFGDYQVSLFTGQPRISIPIFEVKSGGLSVPITLSYHASGIKPTDVASWVGMGWALSAGGQISRKVNGTADENGYYRNTSAPFKNGANNCTDFDYLKSIALGTDMAPDIFSYSFPGKDGKFVLSNQGTQPPNLIPYEPIIITAPNPSSSPANWNQFNITDEQGVNYTFGGPNIINLNGTIDYAIEGASTVSSGGSSSATSAWLLTRMEAPNTNDYINFLYQNIGTSIHTDATSVITIQDNCDNTSILDLVTGMKLFTCPSGVAIETTNNVQSTVNSMGVGTINYKSGKVEFYMGPLRHDQTGQHSLDSIKIFSKINSQYILIKQIKFIYSYFKDASNTNDIALKLDQLLFLDNTHSIIEKYRFSYHTNKFSWNNQFAKDYWGYFNGKPNTNLIPPTSTGSGIVGSADRSANPQYLTEGVLETIYFPTGGYTQFTYEPQQYMDYSGAIPTVITGGGIRIAKILSSAEGQLPVTKTYKYGLNESGYGIANFTMDQFNFHSNNLIKFKYCFTRQTISVGTYSYQSHTYFSTSSFDLDGFDSAPIIYPNVTEYFGDKTGDNIGRKVYEYDDSEPAGHGASLVVPTSGRYWNDSFAWRNGFLTNVTTYDKANNKVQELKKTYGTFNYDDKPVGYYADLFLIYMDGSDVCASNPCDGTDIESNTLSSVQLTLSIGAKRLLTETEYLYDRNDPTKFVSILKSYSYEPTKLLLTQTTSSRNQYEQSVTVTKYPFQYSPSASSTGNAKGIYLLNQKNIVSPVESYTYVQNLDNTNQRLTAGNITTYKQNAANANQVVPDQVYIWESAMVQPLSGYVSTSVGTNSITMDTNYKARVNLASYDANGNVLQVAKTNDVFTSYQYGYNTALPVAEVTNAQNRSGNVEFMVENFEENNNANVVSNSSVAHSGNRYYNGAYTTSFVPPNARTYVVEYWYLSNGSWQQTKVPYTGSGMVLNNGTAIDNVRIYPSDAQLKSYTHDPILGITSVINQAGLLKLYDYDNFGRLKRIRNEKGNVEKQFLYNYKGN